MKRNYVHMKTTELIKLLRRAVNESDELPLTDAELRLYTNLDLAAMAYQDEVRLGHPPVEQRCMICKQPMSQCCC